MKTTSTYKTKVLLPRKRRAYQELFVALFFMVMAISSIPYTESYNRQTFLYNDFIESKGCVVFDDCPQYINDQTLEEMNGLYTTSHYEYGTKEWMKSYCEYSPNKDCIY